MKGDPILLGLALLVLGIALLRYGLWPRRRGADPYCRKCDYNLTGLDSDRCPECGTPITPETKVIGQRNRRPRMILAGILFLLSGMGSLGVIGYARVSKIDLYRYYPTAWVMNDLWSRAPGKTAKAWDELNRRWVAGKLSPANQSQLADWCLVKWKWASPIGPAMLSDRRIPGYLIRCYLDGLLSDAQKLTFLYHMAHVRFDIRPQVLQGRNIVFASRFWGNVEPNFGFWCQFGDTRLLLDGRPLQPGSFPTRIDVDGRHLHSETRQVPDADIAPGPHTLSLTARLIVFQGRIGDVQLSTPCHQEDVRVDARFDVLPEGGPSDVKLVSDPSMEDKLQKSFRIGARQVSHGYGISHEVAVQANSLPCNVAFDIIIRGGGRTFRRGSISGRTGTSPNIIFFPSPSEPNISPLDSLDVILRSSPNVARSTVDICEIWEGELIFTDVPVEEIGPRLKVPSLPPDRA